uniref:C2H2-type domain-containing protein n=1 Tax=Rhabditophanes sp. KR3021 TaxID=114890 RepID=A0AC35TQ01_9BILA
MPKSLSECPDCFKMVLNVDEHEAEHFKDRTGKHALMECHNCFRTFKNMTDLKHHISTIHKKHSRANNVFVCPKCDKPFLSQTVRDQHVTTHIPIISTFVMEAMEQKLEDEGSCLEPNECMLCHHRMSTRKSFRIHMLFRHVLREPKSLIILINNKDVLRRIPQHELDVISLMIRNNDPKKCAKQDTKKRKAIKALLDTKKRTDSGSYSSGIGSSVGSDDDLGLEEIKKDISELSEQNNSNDSFRKFPEKNNNDMDESTISNGRLLRDFLLKKCLKSQIKSSNAKTSYLCICGKTFLSHPSFECHVGLEHVDQAY